MSIRSMKLLQIPVLITVHYRHIQSKKMGRGKRTEGSGTSFHCGHGKRRSFNLEDSRRVQATMRHYCACPEEFSTSWKCPNSQTFWKTTKDIAKRDHRHLEKLVKDERKASARNLATKWSETMQKSISVKTTRRRLNSLGYHGRQGRKYYVGREYYRI